MMRHVIRATFLITGLSTCPFALGFQAIQSEAERQVLAEAKAELERAGQLLNEQMKVMEALRETIARQQERISRIQAGAGPASAAPGLPRTAALGASAPEPTHDAVTPSALALTLTAVQTAPAAPAKPASDAPKSDGSKVTVAASKPEPAPAQRQWYQKYSFRGYSQFRYNRLFSTNGLLSCEQCDRSVGLNNGFFVRRARFILSGDVNDKVYIYFQPDFASTAANLNYGQLRDLYFDVAFDQKKEFRVRIGQSKIPFGFENLQSSQNRLSLDRADSLNSAHANERDLGAFFYWAPAPIRRRFADLVSTGLKGSGDYGVFGIGVYNGQVLNRTEANNNLHTVGRVSYPFKLRSGQIIEPGIQAYTGRYTVTSDQRSASVGGPDNFADQRAALSLVVYPQPFGFQAEYNVGTGPRFNPATKRIQQSGLQGGYAQTMYMRKLYGQTFVPFVRYQYYSGGKKQELDARNYLVRDLEVGVEWQPNPFVELVGLYVHSDRTFEDSRTLNNRQRGNLFRIQMQFNY